MTLPAGVTDTNPANNSATDTDSVTAAPIVADLVVTKSDGATELLPGSATTYTITVTNKGPDAVTGATLTDTAPAGLTFGNWTCVATAGSSCASGGAGNLSTPISLLAGGTATFSVPATVGGNAPESVANTAIATVPNGMTDPVPANNRATDVNEAVPPQSLAVEVRSGDPTVVGPAAFEVPYSIDVKNTGPNPLTNLQVSDSLTLRVCAGRADADHGRAGDRLRTVRRQQRLHRHRVGVGPRDAVAQRIRIGGRRAELQFRVPGSSHLPRRRGDSGGGADQPRDGAHIVQSRRPDRRER